MSEILSRTISSAPEILEGIRTGLYKIWGGVIRYSDGHAKGGQIVGHLQFPNDTNQVTDQIAKLQQMVGNSSNLMTTLNGLQTANLALSGLNLAVSVAGFIVVCQKLNKISEQLNQQSEKLDAILKAVNRAEHRGNLEDEAKFLALLKILPQFAEQKDIIGLKNRIPSIIEQYEFTKLSLNAAVSKISDSPLDLIASLQNRMMHLSLLLAFVQQHTGGIKFATEALCELKKDWLEISKTMVNSIAMNQEWAEKLTADQGDKIISILQYRKDAMHGIEYQTSLLKYAQKNPEVISLLHENISEARFLLAA